MDTWIHGGEMVMLKNPLWPDADSVQIERVELAMIQETSTAFALYENNELDTAAVPLPEIDRVKADPVLGAEFYSAPVACTYYYGFTNTKPPFDDVRVRRAFSAAIDRQSLVDNVTKGGQIPATSFAPPGIFGAVEPGTVGQGYDPDAAKASLQEYLDENGMSVDDFNAMGVTLMHNTSEGHARIAAAIQQMWQDTLGVETKVENQEWAVYLDTIRNTTPVEDMPHVWRLGWCADYADQNNWVHEVFNSDAGANRLRRNCEDPNCGSTTTTKFDELTLQAQQSQDPAEREALYLEAETILSSEEVAYAPIYHYTTVQVTKPWLERTYPSVAPIWWVDWVIDADAKAEATGN
jgi:oligopeptide transport system substrate-binding protein